MFGIASFVDLLCVSTCFVFSLALCFDLLRFDLSISFCPI